MALNPKSIYADFHSTEELAEVVELVTQKATTILITFEDTDPDPWRVMAWKESTSVAYYGDHS
jgi:hypothetical protein